jgi:hypothetical protein
VTATAPRTQRREIRLTAEEATQIGSLARAKGVSVSEYLRRAALRGSGLRTLVSHRALRTDAAGTIRQLTVIAAEVRRLVTAAQGTFPEDELRACIAQVQAVIGGLAT